MVYNAVIFDFDYTLGDSTNGIVLSVNHALKKMGYLEKSVEEIRPTIGFSLKDTFLYLTGTDNDNEAILFSQYFKEKADLVMVDNTQLYDGVKESIVMLKSRKCKLAVVTTKYHYRIEQILAKYDMLNEFDLIVGAEDVKIEKPNPEGLLWAINSFELNKKNVLYVGDSLVDAQTAENACVDFIGVLTGTTTKEDFEKYPNLYITKDINEMCQKIL